MRSIYCGDCRYFFVEKSQCRERSPVGEDPLLAAKWPYIEDEGEEWCGRFEQGEATDDASDSALDIPLSELVERAEERSRGMRLCIMRSPARGWRASIGLLVPNKTMKGHETLEGALMALLK